MMKNTINTILFTLCLVLVRAQSPAEIINTWADAEQWKHAHVGIALHDINSGLLIAGYNHDKCFVPASSLKVLSSFATLDLLGKDFTYKTVLAYDGQIVDSVLTGNVYVIGSGDPSLASKRYADKLNFSELPGYLASKISTAGIRKIEGKIICDESCFDSFPIAPSWQWNDLGSNYACGAWGININENEYDIWYNTRHELGDTAELLTITPDIPSLTLSNEVIIDEENTGDNSYIFGGPYDFEKRIVGTLPKDRQNYRIKGSIPDPPRLLAQALKHQLSHLGISALDIQVVSRPANHPTLTGIDTLVSMPLADLVRSANFHSINLYCEAFLKTLGIKLGRRGAGSEGIMQIKKYLNEQGLDTQPLNMEDGSGLSARNYITPNLLSGYLAKFAAKQSPAYAASLLPEAGSQGTVRRLLKNSDARGHIWMKSGSLNKIISYTGLMQTKNNSWYSFSIMINAYQQSNATARKYIEELIDQLYSHL
ncbi:MAG: D-alanyl-D-alanine carboxypeptidase/D-alanyl-D-alanine-endopeptidase [Saprospiraceae bacterium]